MLNYNRGILYSKAICDFLADRGDLRDYEIWVETFNNCRESGYCLNVNYYEKHEEGKYFSTFYIWIHESRNGEECVIRWGDEKDFLPEELNFTNMYSEKIYAKQSKYFYPFSPHEIADFIAEKIKAHFRDSSEDIDERWIEKQEKERLTRKQQEELEEMLSAAQDGQE